MKEVVRTELFRKLPSVDELLRSADIAELVARAGHKSVSDAVRRVLDRLRGQISDGNLDERGLELAVAAFPLAVDRDLRASLRFSLRPVVNATGVILHTNLGRAPVATAALDHLREVASGYSNLEFDINSGERGKRDIHADRLFRELFKNIGSGDGPAEIATIVVNNNAAAVLIALNTLAEGGEVIVSRGELVEIGGSFRIPDVMAKSGAVLREVGTTNRTRVADYERAINERTKLLLRVHRSNFAITGFTEQPSLAELVELGRKHSISVMEDLGSGGLFDLRTVGVYGEPGVAESLEAGIDVVTYSGDKLLGGPQAGIISGRSGLVAKIRSNPLFRAMRVDKFTYAALEATLLAYVQQDYDAIPALRMMRLSCEDIERRAAALIAEVGQSVGQKNRCTFDIVDGESVIGGGAAPGAVLPTRLIAVQCEPPCADELAERLRLFDPPIVMRVVQDRVMLDLRTVAPEQDAIVIAALRSVITS